MLNACRLSFIGKDWQNVQLPGADLRYGIFAHSDLRGANLRGTSLMHTIWYQAKLDGADLREVRWGEWPRLKLKDYVNALAQHPTQPWVAVAQGYAIELWNTETGERIGQPWQGHTNAVMSCAFSPDGKLIVSGNSR